MPDECVAKLLLPKTESKTCTGVSAIKKEDGSFALNDKDKADTLNIYFSTVFTIEDTCNIPIF